MPAALLLLALSLVLGAVIFGWTLRRLLARSIRRNEGLPLGELDPPDLPGLIALALPRSLRTAWNLAVLAVVAIALATPHWLALRLVAVEGDSRAYAWWLATLPWWLALTAAPALACARHRAHVRGSAS